MYNTITPNKSGGCRQFVTYLDKEDSLSEQFAQYLDKESQFKQEYFFNGNSKAIDKEDVIAGIDHNCKGLKRDESRFFSLTINPSQREIRHLEHLADEQIREMKRLGITDVLSGTPEQIREALVKDMLKEYAVTCMDRYAENFGREGVSSNKDLVWFGRVEKDRYWKYTSPEVKHNKRIDAQMRALLKEPDSLARDMNINMLKKEYILESDVRRGGKQIPIQEMMPKSGINYHIHIVVSRRDKEQKRSLSPLAKARSNEKHMINGQECKIGFNRDQFTQKLETSFDRGFSYERMFTDSYQGRKLLKENPELYRAKEAECKAQWQAAKDKQREQKPQTREDARNINQIRQLANVGNKIAYSAGLNYIHDGIKPYRQSFSTAYQGIKILTANRASQRQMARLGKSAAYSFARGAGLSAAVSQPYLFAIQLGTRAISAIAHGL